LPHCVNFYRLNLASCQVDFEFVRASSQRCHHHGNRYYHEHPKLYHPPMKRQLAIEMRSPGGLFIAHRKQAERVATASASVHAAEIFTTGISGAAHWRLGNVQWATVRKLAVAGMFGGAVAAYVLITIPADIEHLGLGEL
jgi:hypothetical protein